jgi:hypothetical protein
MNACRTPAGSDGYAAIVTVTAASKTSVAIPHTAAGLRIRSDHAHHIVMSVNISSDVMDVKVP